MDTTSIMDNNYNGGAADRGISGFTLKIIAVVTMLIDHAAATLLLFMLDGRIQSSFVTADNWQSVYGVYWFLRGVGRMAFPIYCFLLVEGFTYTRNRLKYAGRLLLFSAISEVPFDMAFNDSVLEFSSNNVFFTLFIGLLTIIILDWLRMHRGILGSSKSAFKWFVVNLLRCIGMMTVILGMMALAEYVLHTDYGAAGVGAIVILYLLKNYRKTGFACAVIFLALLAGEIELAALLMLIPLHFYNGTRGKQLKYFFYLFYPVHLAILVGIAYLMGYK